MKKAVASTLAVLVGIVLFIQGSFVFAVKTQKVFESLGQELLEAIPGGAREWTLDQTEWSTFGFLAASCPTWTLVHRGETPQSFTLHNLKLQIKLFPALFKGLIEGRLRSDFGTGKGPLELIARFSVSDLLDGSFKPRQARFRGTGLVLLDLVPNFGFEGHRKLLLEGFRSGLIDFRGSFQHNVVGSEDQLALDLTVKHLQWGGHVTHLPILSFPPATSTLVWQSTGLMLQQAFRVQDETQRFELLVEKAYAKDDASVSFSGPFPDILFSGFAASCRQGNTLRWILGPNGDECTPSHL